MKIYNTLTRKIEEFIPNEKGIVRMYTCGPTVYHYAHIGNLRSYIMEDILEKTLLYDGYEVKRVMNITDVGHLTSDSDSGDDKMVRSAKKAHKTVMDIAKFYTEAFFRDCSKLNIKKPEVIEPATNLIPEYISLIETLIKKGYAYLSGGNVYFDTSKLKDYYVLTNHKEDEMVVGVREGVENDSNKKNQADFVLWFTKSKFEDQELKWNSPWGLGYPGWHIECSCISMKHLGEYLDIHCGGVDNIFPHHTNEIAQSEAFLGHKWCNYWVHCEHLNDKNGKMSKSKGDFLTISLLEEKGYNPLSYRLMCLQSHYRKQLIFTYENLDNSEQTYKKLKQKTLLLSNNGTLDKSSYNMYNNKFKECINDDMNTALALTVLYDVLKDDKLNDITKKELVKSFDKVLSLDLLKKEYKSIDKELEKYIEEKIKERQEAKQNKNYELADKIREELKEKKVELKDSREGTTWSIIA